MHSIGVDGGLIKMINSAEYAGRQHFYILLQQKLLELLFEKYGVEGETKEAITDNKIQVAGINFDELRECIPDMLGSLRRSKIRAELDAAASRKLANFCALYTKFIDKEVVVRLLDKWMLEETKNSIDGLTHQGLYDQFGIFDPNNAARIALHWTQKDVSGIFGKVVLEYQECMKKYTMGTGDGPGAPKNFATWETRDESYVSLYTQHDANLYLAVVHIWDKQYGFPFVPRRDPMPDHCMIDELLILNMRNKTMMVLILILCLEPRGMRKQQPCHQAVERAIQNWQKRIKVSNLF